MNIPATPPDLAIIIPVYNEVVGVEACIHAVLETLPRLDIAARLVVVDDGSKDGTGELLDKLKSELGGFDLIHKTNGGYGSALRAGAIEAARLGYHYALFMDSDLTNPPDHIARFVPFLRRGFDLVKGSRFEPGGRTVGVPAWRHTFSIVASMVSRATFRMGTSDCTNGFRAIRTQAFLDMPLAENNFSIILEELYWAKRRGLSVASVATTLSFRTDDQRPSSLAIRPAMIWSYLRYCLRACFIARKAVERRPLPVQTA